MDKQTEKDLNALADSLTVIEGVLGNLPPDGDAYMVLERNVRHVEIMLGKQHIVESGADLQAFEDAAVRGRDALTEFVDNRPEPE